MIVYTAVGKMNLNKKSNHKVPIEVCSDGKTKELNIQEMILWSVLVNRVLSKEDLMEMYYKKIDAFLFTVEKVFERDFEKTLQRLRTRNIIVQGEGHTCDEAVYNLVKNLYITPMQTGLWYKINGFFYLCFQKHVPIGYAVKVFQPYQFTKEEAYVLKLVKQTQMNSAEVIQCAEMRITDVSSNKKLMKALYDDHTTTCYNICHKAKHCQQRTVIIKAILQLYKTGFIRFENLEYK